MFNRTIMMLKYLIFLIFTIYIIDSSFAEPCLSDTLFFVDGIPVFNEVTLDLDGNNEEENVKLTLIEDDIGWKNFVLTINNDSVFGKHSYNVNGFLIIDLDTSDKFKEVAVYTPNVNGPDEYIIYKYDKQIKEIGRINSYATFPGNREIIVRTLMMFWSKIDTVFYDEVSGTLVSNPKEFYEINIEAEVLEPFSIYSDRENFMVLEELDIDDVVVVIACDTSPLCGEETPNSYWYCGWYQIKSDSDEIGWAQLKSFLYKLDLPWRP